MLIPVSEVPPCCSTVLGSTGKYWKRLLSNFRFQLNLQLIVKMSVCVNGIRSVFMYKNYEAIDILPT